MSIIHLDWRFCPDGYRTEILPAGSGATIAESFPAQAVIVPESGRLLKSTPLKIDGLYRQLADCKTAGDALRFVGLHGFLRRANKEPVDEILVAAADMREVIAAAGRKEWARLSDAVAKARGIGRLGVFFTVAPDADLPALQFRPDHLHDGLKIQALMDFTGGARLRKCANPTCPEWFKYGPGTEHRETALYHAPKCQKAHAYAKMKEARS